MLKPGCGCYDRQRGCCKPGWWMLRSATIDVMTGGVGAASRGSECYDWWRVPRAGVAYATTGGGGAVSWRRCCQE
jgi:hypothetical protein